MKSFSAETEFQKMGHLVAAVEGSVLRRVRDQSLKIGHSISDCFGQVYF
jgi:hypothetical protein